MTKYFQTQCGKCKAIGLVQIVPTHATVIILSFPFPSVTLTITAGSGYTIFAYRMNRGHELFVTVLEDETNQTPSKETWEAVAVKYMPGMPLPYEDYLTYRDKIYRIYLPETKLSDDTERYLDEILADSESDYESLCRIQNMRASRQYT